MRYRASRDGWYGKDFHDKCDGDLPLLILIKTDKNIVCGGFSSIGWKSTGGLVIDKKQFIFSLKSMKIYLPQSENPRLFFSSDFGPYFGYYRELAIYAPPNTKMNEKW